MKKTAYFYLLEHQYVKCSLLLNIPGEKFKKVNNIFA